MAPLDLEAPLNLEALSDLSDLWHLWHLWHLLGQSDL